MEEELMEEEEVNTNSDVKSGTIDQSDVGRAWYLDEEHVELVASVSSLRHAIRLLLWICGVLMVLIVGLGLLTFNRNSAIDRLQDSTLEAKRAASEAKIASDKAAVASERATATLEEAINQSNSPELVSAFQRMLILIEQICSVLNCEGG